jgi:hypothetical protein
VCSLGIALRIAFLHTEQIYVFVSCEKIKSTFILSLHRGLLQNPPLGLIDGVGGVVHVCFFLVVSWGGLYAGLGKTASS